MTVYKGLINYIQLNARNSSNRSVLYKLLLYCVYEQRNILCYIFKCATNIIIHVVARKFGEKKRSLSRNSEAFGSEYLGRMKEMFLVCSHT